MKYSKTIVIFSFVCILFCKGDDKYTTKYDNVDVQEILSNQRLLKNYVNCLMDRGSCTPDAAELKRVLPEALQTDCTKCSPKQKELTKYVLTILIKEHRAAFNELQSKYDPSKKYVEKYADELRKQGIVI